MIDLYTWQTPNGEKPVLMLEECGLDYDLHMIDISAGEQKTPDFLAINPNGKIPAIVDTDGGERHAVFESGAILIYLAEKTGKFLPASGPARYEALQWTFFQVGGTGPMLGQWHHFRNAAPEKIPYAVDRYKNESLRLLGVLVRGRLGAIAGAPPWHLLLRPRPFCRLRVGGQGATPLGAQARQVLLPEPRGPALSP